MGSYEEIVLTLPLLKGGVISLGDLWDCRGSTSNGNLFAEALQREHLEAFPMQDMTYTLKNLRSFKHRVESLEVHASLSLEMAMGAGNLKIEGSADFSSENQTTFEQEELKCSYKVNTFVVNVRPCVVNLIDPLIKGKLLDGTIKATHYVQAIRLGSEANASIKYRKNLSLNNQHIGGSFNLEIDLKAISVKAKAELSILTDEKSSEYSTDILVSARPGFSTCPVTVEDMFQQIESLDERMVQEQHYADTLGTHVVGVPMSFKLVPLSYLIPELEIVPLFKILESDFMEIFQNMICTLRDFQGTDQLKRLVREADEKLVFILRDSQNPLTKRISTRELEVQAIAAEFLGVTFTAYAEYKEGIKGVDSLVSIVKDYDDRFNLPALNMELQAWVEEGKREIMGILSFIESGQQFTPRFFSNSLELTEWLGTEAQTKILLRTMSGEGYVNGTYSRLLQLLTPLGEFGIETGISCPNISNEFSLTLSVEGRHSVFKGTDIQLALELLRIHLSREIRMSSLAFTILGILNGVSLCPNNLGDFGSIVNIMKDYQELRICETYVQLLASLLETQDTWNFVIPVQALNTSLASMATFRQLQKEFPVLAPKLNVKWFVGKFDLINSHDAPLLIVFFGSMPKAVCLDNLDLLILKQNFTRSQENPNLSTLSIDALKVSCLYPERANFALEALQGLNLDHTTPIHLNDPTGFPDIDWTVQEKDAILEMLEITRSGALQNELELINTAVHHIMKRFPDFWNILTKHGWTDAGFTNLVGDWNKLLEDVMKYLDEQLPYVLKISTAINSLIELKYQDYVPLPGPGIPTDNTTKLHNIIRFLVDFDSESFVTVSSNYHVRRTEYDEDLIFAELRNKLEEYRDSEYDTKYNGVLNAMKLFLESEYGTERNFYISQLVSVLQDLIGGTLKSNFVNYARSYYSRINSDLSKYSDADRKIQDSLKDGNLFKVLSLVSGIRVNTKMYIVHEALNSVTSITEVEALMTTLEKLKSAELCDTQLGYIWANPRFEYWIRQEIENAVLLEFIFYHFCSADETIPSYIPEDIISLLHPFFSYSAPEFEWKKLWESIDDIVETLQIFVTQGLVPEDFPQILLTNMLRSSTLREEMLRVNALVDWNEADQYFNNSWGLTTVVEVLKKLMNLKSENGAIFPIIDKASVIHKNTKIEPRSPILVSDTWKQFTVDGKLTPWIYTDLFTCHKSQPMPNVPYHELNSISSTTVLPYVFREIKNGNTSPLHPRIVQHFIDYPSKFPLPGYINFEKSLKIKVQTFILSRGDLLTALLTCSDTVIAHHVLCCLVETNMAVPLLLPSITTNPAPRLMLQLLQNVVVPDLHEYLEDSHLLKQPYKLILTIRVGNTGFRPGRSSLINKYLMAEPNQFSALNEPGFKNGKPICRPGLAELICLTRNTCESGFWNNVVKKKYDLEKNEMLLLANLHGDALDFPASVRLLKTIASSLVVFWKIDTWNELRTKKTELDKLIGNGSEVFDLVIDPDSKLLERLNHTNYITSDDSLSVEENKSELWKIFSSALSRTTKKSPVPLEGTESEFVSVSGFSNFVVVQDILDFIKSNTILNIKTAMTVCDETLLCPLFEKFNAILGLTPADAQFYAIYYFLYELSNLSLYSAFQAREKVITQGKEIRNNIDTISTEHLVDLVDELKLQLNTLQQMSLTIQDLIRCFNNRIPEMDISAKEIYLNGLFTYFNSGFPLEFFNCVEGTMWSEPIQFLIQSLPVNTKIFVISIAGLQGTGKSFLLNKLFGTKFTESAGGETTGLQMQLLWMESELRMKLNCDALLVIDSQGLCAPENIFSDKARVQESNLTAFLMAISDICILNTQGDSMQELTGIFESALITLTRLSITLPPTSLLIVNQRVSNSSTEDETPNQVFDQYMSSFQNVIKTTRENDLRLGVRTRANRQFENIISNIRHDEFCFTVGELSHNAVKHHADILKIHSRILKVISESRRRLNTVEDWYATTERKFELIHQINTNRYFGKSENAIQHCKLEEQIENVNMLIHKAFQYHDGNISVQFVEMMKELFKNVELLLDFENEKKKILDILRSAIQRVVNTCNSEIGPDESSIASCKFCVEALASKEKLFTQLSNWKGKDLKIVENLVNNNITQCRDYLWKKYNQIFTSGEINNGISVELSLKLDELRAEYCPDVDKIWNAFLQHISTKVIVVPICTQLRNEGKVCYSSIPHIIPEFENGILELEQEKAFDLGYYNLFTSSALSEPKPEVLSWEQLNWLLAKVEDISTSLLSGLELYHLGLACEVKKKTEEILKELEMICGQRLLPDFKWKIHLYAIQIVATRMTEREIHWNSSKNPLVCIQNKYEQFLKDQDLFPFPK